MFQGILRISYVEFLLKFLLKTPGVTPHMKGVGMLVGNFELNP